MELLRGVTVTAMTICLTSLVLPVYPHPQRKGRRRWMLPYHCESCDLVWLL